MAAQPNQKRFQLPMNTIEQPLNVLVFNWHEPYICLFAHTGHRFYIAPPAQYPNKVWNQAFRPLPANCRPLSWEQALAGVDRGDFDLVVGLALADLETMAGWKVPRLFVMLNMVATDTGLQGVEKQEFLERLKPLFAQIDLAFISEKKRLDWGWEAPVVVSGIDPEEYGGYSGHLPRVLRVGNGLKDRDHMQGFSIQEQLLGGEFPSTVLGENPGVPAARVSRDFADLKAQYQQHRLLLSTLTDQHEDGYNLAVLEAMATGMPVVCTANSSTPIVDGYNGFVSDDLAYLRQKIKCLLEDPELAAELGRNGRQTVAEGFNIATCAAGWDKVFKQSISRWQDRGVGAGGGSKAGSGAPTKAATTAKNRKLKILVAAPANPLSTSSYYERALGRGHEVLTCGPQIDRATLDQWKTWEDQHAFKPVGAGDVDKMGLLERLSSPCDIPLPWGRVGAADVAGRLPAGWRPDLVLWIDAGAEFVLENPGHFDCPSVCLMGDTHTGQRQWRLDYAKYFDHTFLMFDRRDMALFEQAGCARVGWLPAACEPAIHRNFKVPKAYDIVFAGQTTPQWHPDRVRLLERLQQAGFDLRVDSRILDEMALLFNRGRLVFNRSLNGDLNMRVFEALATGSLLLTDRLAPESGLEELFEDRRHLVLYDEGNLEDLARYYIEREQEREEIARQGFELVRERHTYGHRADQLLSQVFGDHSCASCLGQVGAPLPAGAAPPKTKELPEYYRNTRPEVVQLVPLTAKRILEVGCAAGETGRVLKERQVGVEVVGIEFNPQAADLARTKLDGVLCGDIETIEQLPYPDEHFDCLVCGDVLEHLRDPEQVLKKLLRYLKPEATVVCSIPNIRHQSVLLDLLANGRWQYRDEGLLDRTHLHFFTRVEIGEMLARLGLEQEELNLSQSPPSAQMEPLLQAVAALGGDSENLRQEATIIQYIFRARRQNRGGAGAIRASVVIPVCNKAEFTEQCLYTIAQNTADSPNYEVVVVDNGSTDWTRYLLSAFEGDLRLINNDENLGFARACNQGGEEARGDYIVFLNNDTLPGEGWLEALVRLADSDTQIGVVGAKLLYPDTGLVQHAGLEMVGGVPEHVFRHAAADDPRVNQVRDLDMVTGACMLVRRDLFDRLGGFDAEFVNGVEDVDLCLRARELGYRVVYCPDSTLMHYEGTSEGRFDHVNENLRRFNEKWGGHFDASGRFGVGIDAPAPPLRGCWEGEFLVRTSLAHVNRQFTKALMAEEGVELDLVNKGSLRSDWDDSAAWIRWFERQQKSGTEPAAFHLRHSWPPDFSQPESGQLILLQPWEYGRIPKAWLQPLRDQVAQVWAPTQYVRNCFVESGVDADKVVVVPQGVDPEQFRPGLDPYPLPTAKGFRFLFVGGTLERKGIDLLLDAYAESFTREDDVCLVIKDMGVDSFYRNQTAGERIKTLQKDPSCGEIVYLTEDFSDVDLPRLYGACQSLVHPYRGEGFGLPVAEAMACGLGVILTRGGACDDFCSEETVWFLPAEKRPVRFAEETVGQAWFLEPDSTALGQRMRAAFEQPQAIAALGQRASQHIRTHFTWEKAASKAREVLAKLAAQPVSLAKGTPSSKLCVLVLDGADKNLEGLDGLDGGGCCRLDVQTEADTALAEQIESVLEQNPGELLLILPAGVVWSAVSGLRLLSYMNQHPDLALLCAPLPQDASKVGQLQPVTHPLKNALVLRRRDLDEAKGFDPAFATEAIVENLVRIFQQMGKGGDASDRLPHGSRAGPAKRTGPP